MSNVNVQHQRTQLNSIVYSMQRNRKVNPVPPKEVAALDILLRTEEKYREFSIDYDFNQMYDQLLYNDDHTVQTPSYAMAFISYRTFEQCLQRGEMGLHIFADGTFQTVPK